MRDLIEQANNFRLNGDYDSADHLYNELLSKPFAQAFKKEIEFYKLLNVSGLITHCKDLDSLNKVYKKYCNYNHPLICYYFGVSYLIYEEKSIAKKELLKGASYGIKYPCTFYNNPFIDSIGQCFFNLAVRFPESFNFSIINKNNISIISLAYLYLSRCIEIRGIEAFDSLRSRAILFKNKETSVIVKNIISQNMGEFYLTEPFYISDYYFASQSSGSPFKKDLQFAEKLHQNLGDISVGGKEADEYSLHDFANYGAGRHKILFKNMEKSYFDGEFNLNINELNSFLI